ncbi:unnamed protein product [Eruca vesicaria subsp. sativa]|uniref:Uncharacterized protein n=1 Tax=Eruca vesicaria subsp. sativa TaxID=29727 RepID=A0ABC8KJD6_ERUVS|nr:unnamed protein product [Eruca vesicaria subsp. sativa]
MEKSFRRRGRELEASREKLDASERERARGCVRQEKLVAACVGRSSRIVGDGDELEVGRRWR